MFRSSPKAQNGCSGRATSQPHLLAEGFPVQHPQGSAEGGAKLLTSFVVIFVLHFFGLGAALRHCSQRQDARASGAMAGRLCWHCLMAGKVAGAQCGLRNAAKVTACA